MGGSFILVKRKKISIIEEVKTNAPAAALALIVRQVCPP